MSKTEQIEKQGYSMLQLSPRKWAIITRSHTCTYSIDNWDGYKVFSIYNTYNDLIEAQKELFRLNSKNV